MTKFKYNRLIYELPPGIDVEVEFYRDDDGLMCSDFNFVRDAQWGEHLPKFGGIGDEGEKLPTWEDQGIRQLTHIDDPNQ